MLKFILIWSVSAIILAVFLLIERMHMPQYRHATKLTDYFFKKCPLAGIVCKTDCNNHTDFILFCGAPFALPIVILKFFIYNWLWKSVLSNISVRSAYRDESSPKTPMEEFDEQFKNKKS